MNIHGFLLNSYVGEYIVQSFLHSLTAVIVVHTFIRLWKIKNPLIVQKFRFLVILLPVVSFPVYCLLNPVRGDVSFRICALFDSARWLNLAPVSLLLIPLFIGTALVLIFQELIPVTKHWVQSKKETYPVNEAVQGPVKSILSELPSPKLDNYVIESSDPVLFATLGPRPAIVLSLGLLRLLSYDQLKAALAHEVAHTIRTNRLILTVIFLIRLLMFYNPVTLIAFRRAVCDEEKICDDMAAFWTGKPQVLADMLKKFYHEEDEIENLNVLKSAAVNGHNLVIKDRVERLEREANQQVSLPWLKFALTLMTIGIINYYIV